MCEMCLAGYSKAGSSLCQPCNSGMVQAAYAIFGALAGLTGLGAIIFLTLRGKGRASSLEVGIGLSGLRYFQLASLAASFPLEWPPFLSSLFSIINIASSAAGDVLSVECSVGTNFVANARLTFMLPALIATGIAAFWVVREVLKGRPPLTEKVAKRFGLSLLVTLITLHPTLTKLVFEFFHCSRNIAGRSLLQADASIVCWSVSHTDVVWNTAMPA